MKAWTFTFRIEPPTCVVSARNGGSVFFSAYSRLLNQWYLIANGSEEKIDPPQMIFVEADYAKAHEKDISVSVRRPTIRLREGKAIQYELVL